MSENIVHSNGILKSAHGSEGKAMITIRAKGGLGNQLFQYATGCAMSKRLEQKMSIDILLDIASNRYECNGFK